MLCGEEDRKYFYCVNWSAFFVQSNISVVHCAYSCNVKLNTRREITYLRGVIIFMVSS